MQEFIGGTVAFLVFAYVLYLVGRYSGFNEKVKSFVRRLKG